MTSEPNSAPEVELLEALRNLRATVREFSQDVKQPLPLHEASLRPFADAVRALGQAKPAKPPLRVEEYVKQWQEFLGKRRERLERRAVRYLCWEPDVATNSQFQNYLDKNHTDISPQWLQGLVRSCHTRWSAELAAGPIVRGIQRRLESYQGSNHVLLRWKSAAAMILGPRGSLAFADHMLEHLQTIKACCEEWFVDEQTSYVKEAVQHAVRQCHERMEHNPTFGQYLLGNLLPWPPWPLQDFKAAVGATILHPAAAEISESLTRFVLRDHRLGDPRLPRNSRHWIGVSEEARLRFIQWLSRADIEFFFQHVLPDGSDPHGRKAFWLRYVSRMRMSRPLLNPKDEDSLQPVLQQLREQLGHFGRIHSQTSAFLLDFGVLLVIEFSRVGNACYIYQRSDIERVVPDFWTSQSFREDQLKQSCVCLQRVIHQRGWQEAMSSILAQYGIRSG